jgi:hypothetical protein
VSQQERVHKIAILGDNNTLLVHGDLVDYFIYGAVPLW